MDHHDRATQKISAQVRDFHAQKTPFKIYHGYTNSTRKTLCSRSRMIDTSNLNNVLRVDTVNKVALVEPNVSMEKLVKTTLQYGLIPPVVPEFPSITIGGGFAGTAGESSSFRHGFLDTTVDWIEIVIPNGDIFIASRIENADLFDGVKGTFGSLGVTTLLAVRLIPAKPYVALTYRTLSGTEATLESLRQSIQRNEDDFIEAIQYSRTGAVLLTGKLSDGTDAYPIQTFQRPEDEWYYLHVGQKLEGKPRSHTELVPLVDYYFRYDRGAFWTGRYVFTYFGVPFTRWLRQIFDHFLHTKILYHGLHEGVMANENIIQDIAIPWNNVMEFLDWLDQNYGIYPLWLCPIKKDQSASVYRKLGQTNVQDDPILPNGHLEEFTKAKLGEKEALSMTPANVSDDMQDYIISIGVWGPRMPKGTDPVAANRKLEAKVKQLGGLKWLYAHNHYTPQEFWENYDKQWYDDLRTKYHAEYLPSMYDKTRFDWEAERKAIQSSTLRWVFSFVWWIWPMPGIYGLICCLCGSEYLVSK